MTVALRATRTERPAILLSAATLSVSAGLTVLVVRDGTPAWRVARGLTVVVIAMAAFALLRRRGPLRMAASSVLGAVAVPIGVGIGVPHVLKAAGPVPTLAGVLVLVGGLVLFGSGLRALFRCTSRRISFPAAAAAVLVLAVLCWTLGQAVAATNVPRPQLDGRTPADLGLTYREVAFDAPDGIRLAGWYVPSRTGSAAVLLHGAGSTRANVLHHAAVLARHGLGVLLFDARGHGRSEGRAMDFGWFGDHDIAGAVAFLQAQPDVDPDRIGAVGLSMGGEEAIGASASIEAIRAVVAEGATQRVAGDKAWLSDEYGLRGTLSEAVGALTTGFTDLLTSAGPPITLHDAVRASGRPTLLIAAGDVADEAGAGHHIQRAAPDTVELWIVPQTGHTRALETHPDAWEARVIAFLDEAFALE